MTDIGSASTRIHNQKCRLMRSEINVCVVKYYRGMYNINSEVFCTLKWKKLAITKKLVLLHNVYKI